MIGMTRYDFWEYCARRLGIGEGRLSGIRHWMASIKRQSLFVVMPFRIPGFAHSTSWVAALIDALLDSDHKTTRSNQ